MKSETDHLNYNVHYQNCKGLKPLNTWLRYRLPACYSFLRSDSYEDDCSHLRIVLFY